MRIAFGRKADPTKLNEAAVTQQIKDFLEFRGWRPIRFQRTVVQLPDGGAFSTGEPGQADFQFVKYLESPIPGAALVLWVELKAPGKRAQCRCAQVAGTRKRCVACDQQKWKTRERERGAIVWCVDSLEWFIGEYGRTFGFLHSGDAARGQLDLLAGAGA